MEKIELQEIIDVCEEAQSEYIKLYRPLLGYEDEVVLNRGIDDSLEGVLEEIETLTGVQFPADFLQLYLIANGGKYFDINLFPLTNDKNDVNGLYHKNADKALRKEYNIPDDVLIVGEDEEYSFIIVGIDEEGYYYYATWDKQEKVIDMDFGYILELLVYEVDYHTQAFGLEYEESEEGLE